MLFEGPATLPFTPADPPATGPGTRMMWYPDKAAFRVGRVLGNEWDKDSIGPNSMAWGFANIAKGVQSTAWGTNCLALQGSATAWGDNSKALNIASTAWGVFSVASGQSSTCWGHRNIALSYMETVLGQFNDTLANTNSGTFKDSDFILVVGNGANDQNRSNALELYKNGNMRVGGALSLKNGSEMILSDNQAVDVGGHGYIRIAALFAINASDRTVILSDGTAIGQILYLECSTNKWQLLDGTSNTNLSEDHNFENGDMIQLVWNGTDWLEVHYSDN